MYTQNRMNEPPAILSNKDVLYLKDALSWELLASKKAFNLARDCQDQQIRSQLENVGAMHQQHYQVFLSHLQPQSQQQNQQAFSNKPYN